ncbi:HSP20-like chaperone [Gigaspora margarita]|uniref:HSP20-like chaperone n=1 Tax=Gigaspora margarita TaxID=4874 RepID=A0A8H4A1E4_GIGMA|nr:HSP20-like chaperone [Gigaspora margarita]
MTSSILHPEVLWAQRQNELFVTINLVDIKDPKINVTKEKLSFEGIGGTEQKLYQFEINLYKEINPEASKRSQTARSIVLVLDKAEHGQQYWPRLQKDRVKITYLKTDFARWKDEDDDEEEGGGNDPLGGMDFSNLMGSGGGGGGGAGFDDDDSDDEDYPDLENTNETAKTSEVNEESKEAAQEEVSSKEAAKD